MTLGYELIKQIIRGDSLRMQCLYAARELNLPDWWLAGGFLRNAVWDYQHDEKSTPLNDVDLVFYDADNINRTTEKCFETALSSATNLEWDVKNQARMHEKYPGREQYQSSEDAMSYWVETATCVGIRIDEFDRLEICAPLGVVDLLEGTIRYNPRFGDQTYFDSRYKKKGWLETWPKLRVE